jgi:hypothetical protein
MERPSAATIFARSWGLLLGNLAIVVPGLVAGSLAALVEFALEPTPAAALDAGLATRLVEDLAQIVASILSIAYTTGMAQAAWETGRARFSDGARAFRRDGGHVFVAMLVLFALGLVAALLAPFTLGLSLAVYLFFCIYTMAAAVVGERPGLAAVRESVEIAFRRPVPTLLTVVGVLVIAFAMGAVASLLAAAPLIGPLVAALVVQTVIAYVALVIVGEYRALRDWRMTPA